MVHALILLSTAQATLHSKARGSGDPTQLECARTETFESIRSHKTENGACSV